VGELLPRLFEDLGLDEASAQVQLLRVWDAAMGPLLAPHCRPEGMRRGELRARVRDSAWMQRVSLERPGILARLREHLGDAAPASMRLRIGPIEE
jgi:predicted nucleic acid-binding Zn ribbon protein